ncbi:MAG: hypothetical protein DWQ37_08910 [Planctomycetota bacterium]|nr:MAG: hypothetical protein DWQ37_08910 [Planctomycetota bacterium]
MAPVIKPSASTESRAGVPYAFEDLGDAARARVEAARREAEELLARAKAEADQLRREAAEQGRAEALAAAEQTAVASVDRGVETVLRALREAIEEIQAAKAQWLAHWERAALNVAMAIAGRVVRREAAKSPDVTLDLVREALELAAGRAHVQLRLHPEDLATLGPHLDRLSVELGRMAAPEVIADQAISRGGCRVDTQHGAIDQQFEAQLARIEQELT